MRHFLRHVLHCIGRGAAWGSLAMLAIGVVVRVTVQDRFAGFAVVYYALPWPVLMLLPWPSVWRWRRRGRRVLAWAGAGAGVAAAAAWLAGSWFHRAGAVEPGGLRVVFHNPGFPGERWWPPILEGIGPLQADIIGLVEAELETPAQEARLRAAFPAHELQRFPDNLVLLVRGEVRRAEEKSIGAGSRCQVVNVRAAGRELTVVLVDLASSPLRSRREPLAQLAAVVAERAGETLLLMGDFNTPRESVWLRPVRTRLRHAFESAGEGFAETWPMPLPVLCIDQVWSTPDLHPVRCETRWGWLSDHRAIVVDFARGG